jgi:hypothetical protein
LNGQNIPPFLEPRLRLFLSADVVGSTALKQRPAALQDSTTISGKGPVWFSAIQGFYLEFSQSFVSDWRCRKKECQEVERDYLYGPEPTFWKSAGDEILFTKILTDHRQLTTTLHSWIECVGKVREFLKKQSGALDVKSTAWIAGFPFWNKEVAIRRFFDADDQKIEDYFHEGGRLLNEYYTNQHASTAFVDYVGPHIDTGFRLTNLSSSRKMVVSVDVAYLLSMTTFDGEVSRIELYFDDPCSLKGVMGGAPYPIFWINMSGENSLDAKEDKLRHQQSSSNENIKEYCNAFYGEFRDYTFRPFIRGDIGQTLSKEPGEYRTFHENLVKNFAATDQLDALVKISGGESESFSVQVDDNVSKEEIEEVINFIKNTNEEQS